MPRSFLLTLLLLAISITGCCPAGANSTDLTISTDKVGIRIDAAPPIGSTDAELIVATEGLENSFDRIALNWSLDPEDPVMLAEGTTVLPAVVLGYADSEEGRTNLVDWVITITIIDLQDGIEINSRQGRYSEEIGDFILVSLDPDS